MIRQLADTAPSKELWPRELAPGGGMHGGSVQTSIGRDGSSLTLDTQPPDPLDEPDATDE